MFQTGGFQTNSASLNDHFDAVYLINMEKRTDRLALSRFYLNRLGIKFTVMKAVDGTHHKQEFNQLKKKTKAGRFHGLTSMGALGILKTWEKIIRKARKHAFKRVLILEDDVIPIKRFDEAVNNLSDTLRTISSSYKALYLGSNKPQWDESEVTQIEQGVKWFVPGSKPVYGTFAIAIQDKDGFFDDLLEQIHGYQGNIDTFVLNSLRLKDLRSKRQAPRSKSEPGWYVCNPGLFIADVSDSNNMGPREFASFATCRKWNHTQYDRVPLDLFCRLRGKMEKAEVNLRHLFAGPQHLFTANEVYKRLVSQLVTNDENREKRIQLLESFLDSYQSLDLRLPGPSTPPQISKHDLYDLFCPDAKRSKPFAFVVPGYNNEKWVKQNLNSIRQQRYHNYRVIYVDDGSTDDTGAAIQKWLAQYPKMQNRVRYIQMPNNQGPASSRYIGYHLCDDEEVSVLLDGDDWLIDDNVLDTLNGYYTDIRKEVYATYGSHVIWNGKKMSHQDKPIGSISYKPDIIANRAYRALKTPFRSVHLRTGYARLFKAIRIQDLWDGDGHFYRVSTDRAEMFSVLEMAGIRQCNVPKPLHVYNRANSEAFSTSYFHNKEKGNPWTEYRAHANKRISLCTQYPVCYHQWHDGWTRREWKNRIKMRSVVYLTDIDHPDLSIQTIQVARWKKDGVQPIMGGYRLPQKSMNIDIDTDIEKYCKLILEHPGTSCIFLFPVAPNDEIAGSPTLLADRGPFAKGTANLIKPNERIIAGFIKHLKPEYAGMWRDMPGIFMDCEDSHDDEAVALAVLI